MSEVVFFPIYINGGAELLPAKAKNTRHPKLFKIEQRKYRKID